MKMRIRIATFSLALAMARSGVSLAWAEPCTGPSDRAVAARAARELSSRARMIVFCEACGDAAPGSPVDVASVVVRPTGAGLAEVIVDGRPIDLATAFVPTSEVEYRNLALLAGCAATGSSPALRVDRATATGVLIRAAGPPAAARPPIAVAAPRSSDPPTWAAGFLGGLAAFAVASIAAFGLAVSRRRARCSSLPRAAALLDREVAPRAAQFVDTADREDGPLPRLIRPRAQLRRGPGRRRPDRGRASRSCRDDRGAG